MNKRLLFFLFFLLITACTRPSSKDLPIPVNLSDEQRTALAATNAAIDALAEGSATATASPTLPATSTVVVEVATETPYPTATPVALFSDFQSYMWGYEESAHQYQQGNIKACQENPRMFCPFDYLPRLEFLVSMADALGLSAQSGSAEQVFLDADGLSDEDLGKLVALRAAGYYPQVLWCKPEYLVDADRYLCPRDDTKRFEAFASTILIELGPEEFAKITPQGYVGFFKDYTRGSVISGENIGQYVTDVEAVVLEGIYVISYRPFLFDPGGKIKRVQWAVLMDRALTLREGVQ